MLGGLTALIASEVGGAVRRNVTVIALYGLAFLLTAGAVGYGLDAVHTALAQRHGAIVASLSIGGGLLTAALLTLAIALYLKTRPRPTNRLAAAAVAAPVAAKLVGSGKIGWRAGLVAGVVVLGLLLGRQLVRNDDGEA